MSVKFTEEENKVICNIIGACESGGQVYGNQDYSAFAEAYENSSAESSITLGAFQNYGVEAKRLMVKIQTKYPSVFKKLDTANIAGDLAASDWSYYQISRSSTKAKCIIKIISSPEGKKCQDELFAEVCQEYIDHAYRLGVRDHQLLAECINTSHQGGSGATERLLKKCVKPWNIDNYYQAMQSDTGNQVGAYRQRQALVYKWIKQYWPKSSSSNNTSNNTTNNSTGGKSMSKTYPAGYLSNSGHDENYNYANGQAGDNTGTEWELRPWYNYSSGGWDCVLRHPNVEVRALIAELAIEAALNDKIGYDQYERTTFWYQLAKSGYHPKNITVACESDCSAGVSAICKAVGYLVDDSKMAGISPDNWTGSMKAAFKSAGFEVLTASKYLTSSDYLVSGDILLNVTHHTCICISSGSKSGENQTTYDGSTSSSNNEDDGTSLNTTVRSKLYVKRNSTPLRTWAGSDESQLKSYPTVNKNQELGLCDTVKADDGSVWYFVKINDKYGFVDSDDVSNESIKDSNDYKPENNNDNNTITVDGHVMTLSDGSSFNTKKRKWIGIVEVDKGQTLNCRKWPNGEPLDSLPKIKRHTKVYVFDAMLDENDNIWLYIKVKNPTSGKYVWGFVFAKYIEAID